MRNFNYTLMAAGFGMALMAGGSGQALAQGTATSTFTVSATLQPAISVACTRNLSFGTISRSSAYAGGGTINIAASSAGAVTYPAGSGLLVVTGNTSALCTVTNETGGNATAALSGASGTPGDPGTGTLTGVVLTKSGGGATMTADLLLSGASGIAADDILYIGGTLSVDASGADPDGAYESAAVTLTVTE